MTKKCCIPTCKVESDQPEGRDLTFHTVPNDMREKWTELLQTKFNVQLKKYSYICSLHFEPNCFYYSGLCKNRRLKKESYPTLFQNSNDDIFISVEALSPSFSVINHYTANTQEVNYTNMSSSEIFGNNTTKHEEKSILHMDVDSLDISENVKKILKNAKEDLIDLHQKNHQLQMSLLRSREGVIHSDNETNVFDQSDTSMFGLQVKQEVDDQITEFKTEIVLQEEETEILDTSSIKIEIESEHETNVFDQTDTSKFVFQVKQEVDDQITEFKTENVLQEEETKIPDTSSIKIEIKSEHETNVFGHTDTPTFVLQEKQEVDNEIKEFKTEITIPIEQPPNTSDNIQEMDNDITEFKTEIDLHEEETEMSDSSSNLEEKSTEIGEEDLYTNEKYLKQLLTKKQDKVKKQRTRMKTLQQKVRRLQNRNKSLEAILKSYKNNKSIPKPLTD